MKSKEDVLKFVKARLLVTPEMQKAGMLTDNSLEQFIDAAASEFNSVPPFTCISWDSKDHVEIMAVYAAKLAVIFALAGVAIHSRGQEYSVSDNGISLFSPPNISDILNSQYILEFQKWHDVIFKVKAELGKINAPSSI